jgi:hypothetical protein
MRRLRVFTKPGLGKWLGFGLGAAQFFTPLAWAADQSPAPAETSAAAAGEVQVIVLGVTAPFFTFGIVKRFEQIPGVQHASFNLLHGRADIVLKPGATVTDDELRQAVRNASFSIGGIHWIRRPGAANGGIHWIRRPGAADAATPSTAATKGTN